MISQPIQAVGNTDGLLLDHVHVFALLTSTETINQILWTVGVKFQMYRTAKHSFVQADTLAWGGFILEKNRLFADDNMTAPP